MPTLEQIRLQLEHSLADLRMMEIAQRPADKWEKEKAAFARGETIQKRSRIWTDTAWSSWQDNPCPKWVESDLCEYRIAPASAFQPRFKVGDRVKIKQDKRHFSRIYDGEQKVIEVMSERARYRLSCSDYTTWPEDALELIPWSLSRHLPGFRALADGEEWSGGEWTQGMLEGGYRPILKGEESCEGGEYLSDSRWISIVIKTGEEAWSNCAQFIRTRRPLPTLPTERVALEAVGSPWICANTQPAPSDVKVLRRRYDGDVTSGLWINNRIYTHWMPLPDGPPEDAQRKKFEAWFSADTAMVGMSGDDKCLAWLAWKAASTRAE